jgi:mgtE-like transporter
MRRPLRPILAHWRAERRTIVQGFVALVIADLGSLVAGLALGTLTHRLEVLPGLMVMVPAAIGMRGNIFGALGSRLGTSIHAGLYTPSRARGGILYQNVYAVSVLTLVVSLFLGVLAKTLSSAFGLESISLADFVAISILGGVISSVVVGAFAIALSRRAYEKRWDLDSVAAPLITAAGDMVTIPALFLATFIIDVPGVTPAVAGLAAVGAVAITVRGLLVDLPVTRRIIRESILVLFIAGGVDVVAGLVIEARLEHFLVYPALLVLIPPFLESAGALGGILSARLASKLHLGTLTPRGWPESVALLDASIIFLFALRSFVVVALMASLSSWIVGLASPGVLTMLGVSLVAGLMVTVLAVVVAYYTAVATFRVGLDPDNHGVAVITSTMDLLGVVCVVVALLAFGVV